eukprot:1348954-Prymnesium_polylepis.1
MQESASSSRGGSPTRRAYALSAASPPPHRAAPSCAYSTSTISPTRSSLDRWQRIKPRDKQERESWMVPVDTMASLGVVRKLPGQRWQRTQPGLVKAVPYTLSETAREFRPAFFLG